jgi:protein-disulfide isomerase-like protein with CxxC motif
MAHAPINAPHQVAHHWEEMARHLGMPMTGAVWHTDPLDSSDRPARAVHAAAQQRPDRALPFLRRLREALFLAGQNITRDAVLAEAARAEGLDPQQLLADTDDPRGAAWARFEADLALGEALGVRAFPTMRLTAPDVPARVITGLRPWRALQNEVLRVIGTLTGGVAGTTGSPTAGAADLAPTAGGGAVTDLDALTTLLAQHDSWTAPEVAVACDRAIPDTHHLLARAEQQGRLVRLALPGGPLWRKP